jgi:hypothetical protein
MIPGDVIFRLYDPWGRLVKAVKHTLDGKTHDLIRLNLSGMKAGVYVWEVTGSGFRRSGKISVVK